MWTLANLLLLSRLLGVCASPTGTNPAYKGTAMLAGSTGKHIATAGRLGSGPALGPKHAGVMRC